MKILYKYRRKQYNASTAPVRDPKQDQSPEETTGFCQGLIRQEEME